MALALLTHDQFWEHDTGAGHVEHAGRLTAVAAAVEEAGFGDALLRVEPIPAQVADLRRVHQQNVVDTVERLSGLDGRIRLDPDTVASSGSGPAALLAAGAGLTAVQLLDAGLADAAFCAVRPPGHHATPTAIMGFCLLNNVAITAAALAARHERVLIIDFDAHHGNGTESMFWQSSQVAYLSLHQYPHYPGTGPLGAIGEGEGTGFTVNIPFPARSGGQAYASALHRVIQPFATKFEPTWLLISAGFDAHEADPLCNLGLLAEDFGLLTAGLRDLVPPQRMIAFLEGGYHLDALAKSAVSTISAMLGAPPNSGAWSTGSTGLGVVDDVVSLHGLG